MDLTGLDLGSLLVFFVDRRSQPESETEEERRLFCLRRSLLWEDRRPLEAEGGDRATGLKLLEAERSRLVPDDERPP